jgi:alkanesulfonate monooxygenase SsuD/methylene tetrahydromethanopterin reductase-like flavin-dependent oxidoreductase (luciferase family)
MTVQHCVQAAVAAVAGVSSRLAAVVAGRGCQGWIVWGHSEDRVGQQLSQSVTQSSVHATVS